MIARLIMEQKQTIKVKQTISDLIKDQIPKFNYNKADWDRYENILSICNCEEMMVDDVDTSYMKFVDTVLRAAELSIPICNSDKTTTAAISTIQAFSCIRHGFCHKIM